MRRNFYYFNIVAMDWVEIYGKKNYLRKKGSSPNEKFLWKLDEKILQWKNIFSWPFLPTLFLTVFYRFWPFLTVFDHFWPFLTVPEGWVLPVFGNVFRIFFHSLGSAVLIILISAIQFFLLFNLLKIKFTSMTPLSDKMSLTNSRPDWIQLLNIINFPDEFLMQ